MNKEPSHSRPPRPCPHFTNTDVQGPGRVAQLVGASSRCARVAGLILSQGMSGRQPSVFLSSPPLLSPLCSSLSITKHTHHTSGVSTTLAGEPSCNHLLDF